jgi:perosamine synthetase
MNDKMDFIMQMRPLFGDEEKKALAAYMDEDGFLTEFKRTEHFENLISEYTGAKHCIVVNNGTISLTLSAMAAGIKAGDEIIVPNYTMIATPNSVKLLGAHPIFVDVEKQTLCLDIDLVKNAITPNTRAIMLVSANGRYPRAGIQAFEKLADDYGLTLIEDAAQSLGSFYPDGRHIGRAGLLGSFSFSAPKIISTGQGGAIITDNSEIADKLRRLKDFGRSGGGNDIHETIGYNFKFTELQACIGIEQMKKLGQRVIRKKEIYNLYSQLLCNVDGIQLFENNNNTTAPWFIDSIAHDRDMLANFLREKGVGSRVMYPPINSQMAYQTEGNYPVSRFVGEKGLWLPSSVQLTEKDIHRVCCAIEAFFK